MHGTQRLTLGVLPAVFTLVHGACATIPPQSLVGPSDTVQEDPGAVARSPPELPDPGAPGLSYTPAMFLYSGGRNPRRAEYAPQEVAVRTRTVDGNHPPYHFSEAGCTAPDLFRCSSS